MEHSAGRFYAKFEILRGAAAAPKVTGGLAIMALGLGLMVSPVFGASLLTAPSGQASSPSASAATTNAPTSTTLKTKAFSAFGTGALVSDTAATTCFGELCNASSGDCECLVVGGTTKAPFTGKATWTAEFTTDDDDRTPTGNGGSCFPAAGELMIAGAKATIIAEVTGPVCQSDLNAGSTIALQVGQAFQIDPTLSTGTAAGLNGGGSFSMSDNLVSGVATMTANGFSAR